MSSEIQLSLATADTRITNHLKLRVDKTTDIIASIEKTVERSEELIMNQVGEVQAAFNEFEESSNN